MFYFHIFEYRHILAKYTYGWLWFATRATSQNWQKIIKIKMLPPAELENWYNTFLPPGFFFFKLWYWKYGEISWKNTKYSQFSNTRKTNNSKKWYPGGPHSGTQLVPSGYHRIFLKFYFCFTEKNEWLLCGANGLGPGHYPTGKGLEKSPWKGLKKKPWEKLKMVEDFI